MSGRRGLLTPKERAFVLALLRCSTVQGAARVAGVSERTAYRMQNRPGVRRELINASRRCLDDAVAQLRVACAQAVGVLVAALGDDQVQHRIRAATEILRVAVTVDSDDIRQRLDQLEHRAATDRHRRYAA